MTDAEWLSTTDFDELFRHLASVIGRRKAILLGVACCRRLADWDWFSQVRAALGLDPMSVGALVSLGSAAGRTMSPVAAVVLMCATLTGANPFALARRVAVPLLAGIAVVVVLRMCGAV